MKKTYQKKDQFANKSSLRISVNGTSKTIEFENKRRNGVLIYETDNAAEQLAIEQSNQFQSGKIVCHEGATTEELKPLKSTFDTKEYPEVTTYAQAKEVMRGEPYKVGATSNSLKTAEGIIAKAVELGIVFPNLKVDEEE